MRRKPTRTVRCAHVGCRECAHYEYDTQRDAREADKDRRPWLCLMHYAPDELLTPERTKTVRELVAVGGPSGVLWNDRNGLVGGPGFRALSKLFPAGTRLRVTAEILLPEEPV